MSQKLDCKGLVKQYTHAISAKLSILQKIEVSVGLTPTKLTSLDDWTSGVLLLLRSDCDEFNVIGDPESRTRYDHNKDLVYDWITKISTILANHDKLIQGNAPPTEEEKKEVKKDVEGQIDKSVATKPQKKTESQPAHATTPHRTGSNLTSSLVGKVRLPDYSNVSLTDLVDLSDVLDRAVKSGGEEHKTVSV